MPRLGWYDAATNNDNVTDTNNIAGWATVRSAYGNPFFDGAMPYSFGQINNGCGTWGQFIFENKNNLWGKDLSTPSGLDQVMPLGNAPDGSKWVQGHLVNGECGGRGDVAKNLTPISHNVNMRHKSYEAVIQKLVGRGDSQGDYVKCFNHNKIPNTRLIYRTHALQPQGGYTATYPTIPAGIAVSLGFVINGVMQSLADVAAELFWPDKATPQPGVRWFPPDLYNYAKHKTLIVDMVGGVDIWGEYG
jgi:hypothetical protein